jgi:hypothetical protein
MAGISRPKYAKYYLYVTIYIAQFYRKETNEDLSAAQKSTESTQVPAAVAAAAPVVPETVKFEPAVDIDDDDDALRAIALGSNTTDLRLAMPSIPFVIIIIFIVIIIYYCCYCYYYYYYYYYLSLLLLRSIIIIIIIILLFIIIILLEGT